MTAENEVTQNYLSQIPFRDKIHDRLTELWNYPKYGVPSKHGDYFFFFENDGLQNQSVLYRQKSLDGPAEVFLDPNKLSDDGTVALSDVSFSKDGKYCAYAAASSGSDWVEIRVMDVATRELLPDVIRWVKFSGAVWTRDINRAIRVSRRIETGRMWINTYNAIPEGAPFGGYKSSGIGRETHKVILEHYTQQKNIMINLNETPSGFYPEK